MRGGAECSAPASERRTVVLKSSFSSFIEKHNTLFTYFCLFSFERVSLCSPAWPWPCDHLSPASVYWEHVGSSTIPSQYLLLSPCPLFQLTHPATVGRVHIHSWRNMNLDFIQLLLGVEMNSFSLLLHLACTPTSIQKLIDVRGETSVKPFLYV